MFNQTTPLANVRSDHKGRLPFAYNNNPKLKPEGVTIEFTQEHMAEFVRCSLDPEYFILNYCKIKTLDHGLQPFNLYPRQRELIKTFHDERKIVVKAARQTGKTTTSAAYILWYILFNEQRLVAILANKEKTAREILSRVRLAYQELPFWMQQGVVTWNKGDIELENGSRVIAESTASDAIRGYSVNLLFLDEFAHVENNIADEFFAATYPTISSGQTTKIIIVSTPFGFNHYYKIWDQAMKGMNGFTPFEYAWTDVPNRTKEWLEDQKRTLGDIKFRQEILTNFLGSSYTLIDPDTIARMQGEMPEFSKDGLDIYEEAQEGHAYIIIADVSRGQHLDYSAFIVFDVTETPYKIVAKYRNNNIPPLVYPNIIYNVAKKYHNAYVLVEINDAGGQVADILNIDLEYENMFFTNKARMKGNQPETIGSARDTSHPGLRTDKRTRRIGCEAFKALAETDQVLINDYDLILEISTFTLKKDKYQAEDGHFDDLVMCCVLFSWLTTQNYFKDLTDVDIRLKVLAEKQKMIDESVLPIMQLEDQESAQVVPTVQKVDGEVWFNQDAFGRIIKEGNFGEIW